MLQRLLHLVARRAGHADAAHLERVAGLRAQRFEDALDRLDGVAGIAVRRQVQDRPGLRVGHRHLGHGGAHVQPDQHRPRVDPGLARLVG